MKKKTVEIPDVQEIEKELLRVKERQKYHSVFSNTVFSLISVVAVAVLICVLFMPVLRIYGTSMNPILHDGNIVLTLKGSDFECGDIVAFYFNNKILVKRVIASSGEWVNIDEAGNVYVNDVLLDEPYLKEKSQGENDITFPYQVPENKFFVLGDHRETSVDSRSSSLGCVAEEQVVGRIMFCVWPLQDFGILK